MLDTVKRQSVMAFEKLFDICEDRILAIFLFLSMLELIQAKYMTIMWVKVETTSSLNGTKTGKKSCITRRNTCYSFIN
jgi:hypothetical protein